MSNLTKPKPMWAYVTLDGKEFHCYTEKKKACGFWAEHPDSPRIKKVFISFEKKRQPKKSKPKTLVEVFANEKRS